MRRPHASSRRSTRRWAVRVPLAVMAALLGYGALTHAMAYRLRGTDSARAHALAPYDGRITALLSERMSGAEADTATRAESDRMARRALRQDPTAVAALATLGINAQIRGDTPTARQLFAQAQSLSRRDLRTQLWYIEDAVGRGNVPEVLRHYDIALRTSRVAPDLLFPILGTASADPAVRAALVRTLATRPVWANGFIDYMAGAETGGGTSLAGGGADPSVAAQLFAALRRAGVPIAEGPPALVVNALAAARRFDQAWTLYATLRPGADRRMTRDQGFRAVRETPAVFDWVPANDTGITTSIQRNGDSGVFDFAAASGAGGLLLRQLQLLPAGAYRVAGHSSGIDQPADALPYVALHCVDGRELGRVTVPASNQANGKFAGRFIVPSGCPVQYLSLIAQPSQSVAGLQGQLDRLWLEPAQ